MMLWIATCKMRLWRCEQLSFLWPQPRLRGTRQMRQNQYAAHRTSCPRLVQYCRPDASQVVFAWPSQKSGVAVDEPDDIISSIGECLRPSRTWYILSLHTCFAAYRPLGKYEDGCAFTCILQGMFQKVPGGHVPDHSFRILIESSQDLNIPRTVLVEFQARSSSTMIQVQQT